MRRRAAAGGLLALLLGGCSSLADRIDSNTDEADGKTSGLLKGVGRTAPGAVVANSPLVSHEDGIWLGKSVIKLGEPALPPIFYQPATFDRSIGSLSELAERLTLRSGIPSRVNGDALTISSQAFRRGRSGGQLFKGGNGVPPLSLPMGRPGDAPDASARPAAVNEGTASFTADAGGSIRVTYANGSFKGLLDTAAARFGVSWKYADGVIQFFHTDARTFQINAVPGDSSFTASVNSGSSSTGGVSGGSGGGGSGGGGGGGSGGGSAVTAANSQVTGVNSKLSVYGSIESAVKVMLSPYGKVLASPATGAITVVDTPDSLDRVAAYIDNENKALSRQVVINVTVLSVTLNRGDDYGINWNLVYNGLQSTYGIKNTFATDATNPVGFSAGIVGSSKFAGSTLIMQALSQQGKVRRQTTASVVTLNNQPVPVQVAKQTSYLASRGTSLVAQVGTTTTLTPGVVTSGFNMSILPHLLTNGTVMLQFSIDMSTLRGLRQIGDATTGIESPELDTRNFLQRVSMKSSETLVISGFEQTDENSNRSGVGTPANPVLGGGISAASNKEVIVILITPVTMNGA